MSIPNPSPTRTLTRAAILAALLGAAIPSGCLNLNTGTGLDAFKATTDLEAGAFRDAKNREEEAAKRRAASGGGNGNGGNSGGNAH